MIDQIQTNGTGGAAIEARLERIEEQISDLHTWMRSEQVASLPTPYRTLFNHLVARDFERRYAARVVQAVHHASGSRELGDTELRQAAIAEINASIGTIVEALPTITKKRRKKARRDMVRSTAKGG